MEPTAKYRQHHERILSDAAAIIDAILSERWATSVLVRDLADFHGFLNMHLALEDLSLYPRLLRSEVAGVQVVAQRFQQEMSPLKAAWEAFMKRWRSEAAIERNRAAFAAEAVSMLERVIRRMVRENEGLYSVVDAVEETDARRAEAGIALGS